MLILATGSNIVETDNEVGLKTNETDTSHEVDDPLSVSGINLSLLNSIPVGLLVIDAIGRIQFCNLAGIGLFGAVSFESLKDQPLKDYLLDEGLVPLDNTLSILFPANKKRTLNTSIRRKDGLVIPVRLGFSPTSGDSKETLISLEDLKGTEKQGNDSLMNAYQSQKYLNQKLGEIVEVSRTFSLHLNLERVMNQIVRVVSETLGYGKVGLYMKDEKSDRMRVATYQSAKINTASLETTNPGLDWDVLTRITGNSTDLNMIGGKRIHINFGDDTFGVGEVAAKQVSTGSSEIWRLDEYLLALVRLEGSVTSGFIRVSQPIRKRRTGVLGNNPLLDTDLFRQQALWIFANQAAVAIENALLFEKAQIEINDRKLAEKELAAVQGELENRIHTRTLRLEKANHDLQGEIRKRESTQVALDSQEKFLRQVLDINPTLIYVRDRTGRFTLVNEAAARFDGLNVDEIQGKLLSELNYDIAQVIRWRHEDLDVLDNHREMILTEERVKDVHGGYHFLQTIKKPILSSSGESNLVLGVSVDITALKRAEERTIKANVDLAQAYDATIEGWSRALDIRDHETEGHSNRVTTMTLKLAEALGVDKTNHEALRRGALLHDIGKMGIPDEILLKKGALNPVEWEVMRRHPVIAYEMLNPIKYLSSALVIPHYHHEKWSGNGYPEGLAGDSIPLAARIFAIVDVWDAMTQNRVYRPALTQEVARKYITENSGSHFDPRVVSVFIHNLDYIIASL